MVLPPSYVMRENLVLFFKSNAVEKDFTYNLRRHLPCFYSRQAFFVLLPNASLISVRTRVYVGLFGCLKYPVRRFCVGLQFRTIEPSISLVYLVFKQFGPRQHSIQV